MSLKIAIDGPSGSGKSTLAKSLARELKLVYVDTGALYRAIGLYIKRSNIDKNDKENVIKALSEINVTIEYIDGTQSVILNGENVNGLIRTPEISMYASAVSAMAEVRQFLYKTQRDMCDRGNVVMDGRDIGTVIMPDADVKIFITATNEDRAKRRYAELLEKGQDVKYEDVLKDIIERDSNDSSRKVAPAIPAEDAIMLNNSGFEPEDTLRAALEIINKKLGK